MQFTINRPTSNNKTGVVLQVSLGLTNTHHGPYAAQRAAYAADVLGSGINLQVVAGQKSYAIASGTSGLWVGKVLVIYRAGGDTYLAGMAISTDSGTAITMGEGFKYSGIFSWAVVEPFYTLNAWDHTFYFPEDFLSDRNDAVWVTKPVSMHRGTWYAQGYFGNTFGLQATILTSAQTAILPIRTGETYRTSGSGARLQWDGTDGLRSIDGAAAVLTQITPAGVTTIRTAASGARSEFTTTSGHRGLDASGNVLTQIGTDGKTTIKSAASGSRIEIDPTNGVRSYSGINVLTQINAAGHLSYTSAPAGARIDIGVNGVVAFDASYELSRIDAASGKTTLKSAVSAARMEYDQTNGIRVYDASGNLVSQWGPSTGISLGTAYSGARITFDATNGICVYDASTLRVQLTTTGFLKCKTIESLSRASRIDLDESGVIYIDTDTVAGGTLKISDVSGNAKISALATDRSGAIDLDIHVSPTKTLTLSSGNYTFALSTVAVCNTTIQATAFGVNSVQVLGAQGAAVANATDAASVILRLNDLLARCRAHGIIAT
jgi:hypothetical protein